MDAIIATFAAVPLTLWVVGAAVFAFAMALLGAAEFIGRGVPVLAATDDITARPAVTFLEDL